MHDKTLNRRLSVTFLFFALCLTALLGRLFHIQFIKSSHLSSIATRQHDVTVRLSPKRGAIYDRNMRELAGSLNVDSVYADPRSIEDKDKEGVAETLAPILNLSEDFLRKRLSRDKSFVWLKRKVSGQVAKRIEAFGLKGIKLIKEPERFYPNGTLASHLLGFVDIDSRGLEGLELFYDDFLKGIPGWRFALRDGKRRQIIPLEYGYVPPVDGYDLVLCIDEVIQHIAEGELEKVFRQYNAKAATIIVMDPENGEILALANCPTFDLNSPGEFDPDSRRNRAVCDLYEPGSSFKFVTASAVLQEEIVAEEDRFYCEDGSYRVHSHILHDYRPYGWLTFQQVIEKSSNIGTVKAAQALGEEGLYRYIELFGFGDKTHVDLPGEVNGIARPPGKWSKVSIAAIPMGQEIAVTPIQMLCAISAIANDGLLVRPRMVKRVQDKEGQIIKSFPPLTVRRVVSEDVARRLKEILTGVVERGTGKRAQVPGYKVAGKTGTAQKVDPGRGYSHTRFVASFIGFAPARNPAICIVVAVDEPRPVYYGGVVAAPVFQRVANEVLRYLEISDRVNYQLSEDSNDET